jgi:hypothetical protein
MLHLKNLVGGMRLPGIYTVEEWLLPLSECFSVTELPFGSEILRIELVELHNTSMFSARKHFKNRAGEWQPGKMGLTFAIERLPDVVARFESALNRARAERLLP